MQRSCLRPISVSCSVGSALLLCAVAVQALAAGSISGTLKAPAGFSVEGSRVNATNDKFQNFRVDVEANGAYAIEDLEPGPYTLVAVGKGLEPVVVKDLVVKDGQALKQDLTFQAAKPFPIVRAAAPIPLTDDYYSTAFADAPEIRVDQAYQIRFGALDAWKGPGEVSGKFKLKFSEQALHLAADLTFKIAGINNETDPDQVWNGNSIEFFFQNDPLDLKREEYDLSHNWQFDVGLGQKTTWRLYQRGQGSVPRGSIDALILRKTKPNKDGELVRIDIPWSIFPEGGEGKPGIQPPKDGGLGAMDLVVNAADFDAALDEAKVKSGLGWGGFGNNWNNPSVLRPIQFVPRAP